LAPGRCRSSPATAQSRVTRALLRGCILHSLRVRKIIQNACPRGTVHKPAQGEGCKPRARARKMVRTPVKNGAARGPSACAPNACARGRAACAEAVAVKRKSACARSKWRCTSRRPAPPASGRGRAARRPAAGVFGDGGGGGEMGNGSAGPCGGHHTARRLCASTTIFSVCQPWRCSASIRGPVSFSAVLAVTS
jgi:hypothetical protein